MKLIRKVPPIFWILIVAFVLRIWGVTFGIGFAAFHTDEPIYAHYAKTLIPTLKENLKPRRDFPSPYFYTLAAATKVGLLANDRLHFVGNYQGAFAQLSVIAGRLVSVLTSTGTVFLIYLIGKFWISKSPTILNTILFANFSVGWRSCCHCATTKPQNSASSGWRPWRFSFPPAPKSTVTLLPFP